MFEIQETNYGYLMTFEGFLQRADVQAWVDQLRTALASSPSSWGNLVDMRAASAFPADAQETLFQGILYCRDQGMERAAVVISNPISKIQAVRVSKETGILEIARFIDASSDADWEQTARDWIDRAVAPV